MENISSLDVPTIWEMLESVRIFTEYVHNPPKDPLHSNQNCIFYCALAAVWMAGRRYEHNVSSIEKTEE